MVAVSVVVVLLVLGAVVAGAVLLAGDAGRTSGEGWTSLDGVELTTAQADWLDALADQVAGVPLTVTSGVRTAMSQARAMLAKLDAGDTIADLLELYRRDDLVAELAELPQTVDAWAAAIADQVDAGDYLSSHLTGRAFDLRSRDWSSREADQVAAAIAELGGRAVVESDHMHVEMG